MPRPRGRAWSGGTGLLLVNIFGSQLSMLFFYLILGAERLTELVEREQGAVRRLLGPETGTWGIGFTVFLAVGVAPLVEDSFSGVTSIPSSSNG